MICLQRTRGIALRKARLTKGGTHAEHKYMQLNTERSEIIFVTPFFLYYPGTSRLRYMMLCFAGVNALSQLSQIHMQEVFLDKVICMYLGTYGLLAGAVGCGV